MLKINNTKLKKCKIPLILFAVSVSGIFLYQYLIFIPEYSNAAPISTDTPVTITPTTPLAKWDDLQYMQQITPQACADAGEEQSKKLIDNRDTSKSYTITKLKGSAGCWMTENMDYDGGLRIHHDNTYGGYYNWENAKKVCDFTGWQLPTKEQYNTLLTTYSVSNSVAGSITLRSAPLSFLIGGIYNSDGLSYVDSFGNYWASTPRDSYAYNLGFGYDYAGVGDGGYTAEGFSVRCVAKDTSDITPVDPSAGGNTGINDPNISVTVPSIITLDVYSEDEDNNTVNIAMDSNNTGEGNFIAKVSSNSTYNLSLSTTENGHTDLRSDNTNSSIPALSTTSPIITTNDSKWWGIKCTNPSDSTNCKQTNYTGLTDYLTPTPFYTSTQGASNQLTNFTIGIQVSPDLPSGTYSTSILVTASQN